MSAFSDVINDIQKYQTQYHRTNITLLAVSKTQPIEKILALYNEGQRSFGENYLQEALEKITSLQDKDIEWHFIGRMQRNKTKKIAENFSWVQTVASELIAKRLSEQRPMHLPALNICIEVNISHDPNKSGVAPEQVLTLAQYCLTLSNIKLRGLMCIPEQQSEFAQQRIIFRKMFELYQSLQQQGLALDTLSMGMSGDMEAAIAEGSTMLRIGTALFGKRKLSI